MDPGGCAPSGAGTYLWGDDLLPAVNSAQLLGSEAASLGMQKSSLGKFSDPYQRPAPVTSLGTNAVGLHHMAGNLSEWSMDSPSRPRAFRVFCGGNWQSSDPASLRTAEIGSLPADGSDERVGFRLVYDPEASTPNSP